MYILMRYYLKFCFYQNTDTKIPATAVMDKRIDHIFSLILCFYSANLFCAATSNRFYRCKSSYSFASCSSILVAGNYNRKFSTLFIKLRICLCVACGRLWLWFTVTFEGQSDFFLYSTCRCHCTSSLYNFEQSTNLCIIWKLTPVREVTYILEDLLGLSDIKFCISFK